jgi:hypothetical protein
MHTLGEFTLFTEFMVSVIIVFVEAETEHVEVHLKE